MSEVQPSDILLRYGGGTLSRHGVLTIAGARRVHSPTYRLVETSTRADVSTCASYLDRDAIIRLASANNPRLEWTSGLVDAGGVTIGGPLSEGTRTNVVLWNRDMTNAAWVKTTMTAAKDQVGVDGVANSASSLLATAGNATCLQAITLGSSQRAQAVWVKRLVGSGTINMTMDNGVTWTAITLTTSWTRLTIPTQTLANPTVGFRIVTNTDKIAVDYVQNEAGTVPSSSIPTTTAAVVRAADSQTASYNWGPSADITALVRLGRSLHMDAAGALGISPGIFSFGAGSAARIGAYFDPAARNIISVIDTATTDATQTTPIPAGNPVICIQYKNLTTGGQTALDTGSGFTAFSSAATGFSAFSSQTVRFGRYDDELFGVFGDGVFARGLRTRAEMLAIA